MRIIFFCTAFNSLSQRMALVLRSQGHSVTVELALSPELMISAAELASPDIVICPFLTKRVPHQIYNKWLTLVVHPGPPGDAGPSAIDWCLYGDMGELNNDDEQLALIDAKHLARGAKTSMRSHWGVTVLQAIEALDAGPIWAFDQFELDRETSQMTKSDLYRGPVTRAAVNGVVAAIERTRLAAEEQNPNSPVYSTSLPAPRQAGVQCVTRGVPFLGGRTHERPLLKAGLRDFFALAKDSRHLLSADVIVQRINSADSQPGVLTSLFGKPMFVYGAVVQRDPLPEVLAAKYRAGGPGTVVTTREGAVLVNAGSDYPLWICHVRKPKAKADRFLAPKLPAVMGLLSIPGLAESLGLNGEVEEWSATSGLGADSLNPWQHRPGTYQQVYVEMETYAEAKVGYVHANFYNGAFSTTQCEILLKAINWTLAQPDLTAIVMLGGPGYFSNGIALNVIEGSSDPSAEGWANINAIDDCVQALLAPSGVLTFATLRGNAAAGGLAVATAADVVLSIESVVLNPHYRGLGLYGSEWHTYSWYERCGPEVAAKFAREMLPMSATEARQIGLVDHIIENGDTGSAKVLADIKAIVKRVVVAKVKDAETDSTGLLKMGAPWTKALRPVPNADELPLAKQLVTNKAKYLAYMFAGTGSDHLTLQQHFQAYRKQELDQMTFDFFHPHRGQRFSSRCTAFVRKLVPTSTANRFALHRRFEGAQWDQPEEKKAVLDEEELDAFDSLGDVPASAAIPRLPRSRPEYVPARRSIFEETRPSVQLSHSASENTDVSTSKNLSTPATSAPGTPTPSMKAVRSLGDEEALRTIEEALDNNPSVDTTSTKKGPSAIAFAEDPSRSHGSESPSLAAKPSSPNVNVNKFQRFFASIGRKTKVGATEAEIKQSRRSSISAPLAFYSPPSDEKAKKSERRRSLLYPSRPSTAPASRSPVIDDSIIPEQKPGPETMWSCYFAENGALPAVKAA